MSSNKKSKSDDINIEDLIDDEATVEDFEEYNQIFPDLDGVSHLKNHCTSCFKHLGLSLAAVPKIRLHSVLKVTICKSCHEFYNSGEFERGEDGSELFCRWCGQGGVVFCCTNCIYVFCKECIRRNLGTAAYKKIANDNKWCCFRCDSNQLLNLRARHHAFTNYLLNRQNHVNETARNANELKALVQEDMSTCCRASKISIGGSATTSVEKPLEETSPPVKNDDKAALPPVPGPGPSTYKPGPASKRAREISPSSAPGPLSKKLKKKVEVKEPVKVPEISKPVSLKQKVVQRPHLVKRREIDDEPDLMSLLTPNIELEEESHATTDERDPIDPLDFNVIAPNSPWRSSINELNLGNQNTVINPPLEQPDLGPSLHFGGHFMAMDAEPMQHAMPTARLAQSPAIRQAIGGPNGFRPNSTLSLASPGIPRLVLSRPQGNRIFPPMAANRPGPPPGPESPSSVFHYVNGFRIDLKAASEKQLITLPDGKVIHVRRHLTPNGGPINALPPTNPTSNPPPIIMSNYRGPTNVNMRFQSPPTAPLRLHNNSNLVLRRAAPVNIQRPTLAEVLRPRRKTTIRPRAPLGAVSVYPRPPQPNLPPRPTPAKGKNAIPIKDFRPNLHEVAGGKFKLSAMVDKLQDALTYTSQKCTNFQTSKTYKGVRTMEDVIELHTNLSYILLYASSRFNEIMEMNEKQLKELSSKKEKEKEKKATDDELLLLEDRPACINLDSDDEEAGGQSQAVIRCKTVLEINSGNTIELAGPSTQLPAAKTPDVVERPQETVTKIDIADAVINLDDSDDEESTVPNVPNEKIIGDIIDEVIDSLFVGCTGYGDDKENHPPLTTSESKKGSETVSLDKEMQDSVKEKCDIDTTEIEVVDGDKAEDDDPLHIEEEHTHVIKMGEDNSHVDMEEARPSSSESTLLKDNAELIVLDESKSDDDDGSAPASIELVSDSDKNGSESIADGGDDVEKPADDANAAATSMNDNQDVEAIFDDVACANDDTNQGFENARDPLADLLDDFDEFLDCPATEGSDIDTFADCEGVLAELNGSGSVANNVETSSSHEMVKSKSIPAEEEDLQGKEGSVQPNITDTEPAEAPVVDKDSTTTDNLVLEQESSPGESSNENAVEENLNDGQQLTNVEPNSTDLLQDTAATGDSVLEQESSPGEFDNENAANENLTEQSSNVEADTGPNDMPQPISPPTEASVVGDKDEEKASSAVEVSDKNEVAENGIDGQLLSFVGPDANDNHQPINGNH